MGGDEPVVLEVTVAGKHAQSVADLLRGIADGTVVNVRRLAPCPEQTYNLCPLAAVADAQHPAHQ